MALSYNFPDCIEVLCSRLAVEPQIVVRVCNNIQHSGALRKRGLDPIDLTVSDGSDRVAFCGYVPLRQSASVNQKSDVVQTSLTLKRVHRNQKLSQLAKHQSSVSENFRRRCAKFYAWLRTAIRRIKKFGLRLYTSSITLAFASRTTRDRRTHRSDSATRIKRRELAAWRQTSPSNRSRCGSE